jgi:uncharacterized protein YprB with RNaseH-like and TPR domain
VQIDEQDFLRLVEHSQSLLTFDTEATSLNGDYGSILVVTGKRYGQKPVTVKVDTPGKDRLVVREAKAMLEDADAWISYYGKGYDIPMLNARLMRWGYKPLVKRPHLDLYFTLKSKVKISRRSQGHYLSWLSVEGKEGEAQRKMGVSADVWASIVSNPKRYMPTMVKRCESDVIGLEALYTRTKSYVGDIKC